MRRSTYRALLISAGASLLSGGALAESGDFLVNSLTATCIIWWFFLGIIFAGYAYKDAKRRGMNRFIWPVISLIIPIGGFLFYYAVRKPLPGEGEKKKPFVIQREVIKEREIVKVKCPYCGALIDQGLDTCPHCGAPLR